VFYRDISRNNSVKYPLDLVDIYGVLIAHAHRGEQVLEHPEIMEEELKKKFRMKKSALIPIVLLVLMLGALFSSSTPAQTEKVASKADGDTLSWSGTWNCTNFPIFPWDVPCRPTRPSNPKVGVVCAKPQLTVAILIDRSDSVIRDTGGATPALFIKSIELLLDDLFARFDPFNGELNFLLYAFGTKSVIQNAKDSNGNYITDASSPTALAEMKSTLSKIHFRNGEDYPNKNNMVNGFQSPTSNPYDLERAYNAGSESAPGVYGLTNWQDPLVNVLRAQSGPYNRDEPGKKIDLAVMFTDGIPDKSNGDDWNWTPGTYRGNDPIGYSWNEFKSPQAKAEEFLNRHNDRDDLYRPGFETTVRNDAIAVVDFLRSGEAKNKTHRGGDNFPRRPKVSVRGILIHPNATQTIEDRAKYWGGKVFSDGNYYFAKDFDAGLKAQITGMAQAVMEETGCENLIKIFPKLQLTPGGNDLKVEPVEGDETGIRMDFTLTNLTNGPLKNVKICIKFIAEGATDGPCVRNIDVGFMQQEGVDSTWQYNFFHYFTAELGSPKGSFKVTAVGESTATDEELEGRPRSVPAENQIASIPDRVALPA